MGGGMDLMGGMSTAATVALAAGRLAGGVPNREMLSAAREAEKQAAMDAKGAEMRRRTEEEDRRRENKRNLTSTVQLRVQKWAGEKGNIRALLASLEDMKWEGCKWEPIPLSKLLTEDDVR